MLRSLIKLSAACGLQWTGLGQSVETLAGLKRIPLVIGYHRVVDDFRSESLKSIPSMMISCKTLEQHLEWIGRHYSFASLDQAGQYLENYGKSSRPAAILTFDDGYRDIFDNAFPMLQRKGIPFAVFVVSDVIGTSRSLTHDQLYVLLLRAFSTARWEAADLNRFLWSLGIPRMRLAARSRTAAANAYLGMRMLLERLPQTEINRVVENLASHLGNGDESSEGSQPLTWEMLARMHQAGVTIGSHTRTHAFLTNESREKIRAEVASSRETIQKKLGITIEHFAYPSGLFNAGVVSEVVSAGYRFGYTTCVHRDSKYPLFTIPRKILWENSSFGPRGGFSEALMSCQVHRSFDLMISCDHSGRRKAAALSAGSG